MRLSQTKIGSVALVTVLDSRIAADVAKALKESLVEVFHKGERVVVLDLAAVTFIDSSGLSALISVLKTISGTGDLVLCGLGGSVATMFKLTRMDKVFRIFGTAQEGADALASSGPKP